MGEAFSAYSTVYGHKGTFYRTRCYRVKPEEAIPYVAPSDPCI